MKRYFLFFCIISTSICVKLPPNFKKCDRNQSDFKNCIVKAVEHALRQMNKPYPELGLPNLEPLEIPALDVEAGTGSVGFQQHYKNLKISGFTTVNCSKVDINFEAKIITLVCSSPEMRADFKYEINGKILLMPIFGKGPGTVIMENVEADVVFKLEEYEKKKKKFYKVTNCDFVIVPSRVRFDLKNLFNGDKVLSDNIMNVVNDNWKDVTGDVIKSYDDAFGQIFVSIFNNLLGRLSIAELFGSE